MAGEEAQAGEKTLIVLGSGGHTSEILNLSKNLDKRFSPKVYVSTKSDELSLTKARKLEEEESAKRESRGAKFTSVVRIRDVGQSFVYALFLRAPLTFLQSLILMIQEKPDVLLCNGPGVCVPFCLIAVFLNALHVTSTRIIFIESICRVKTLSLTGRILIRFAHEFVVQWEDLQAICQARYPKSQVVYLGRLS